MFTDEEIKVLDAVLLEYEYCKIYGNIEFHIDVEETLILWSYDHTNDEYHWEHTFDNSKLMSIVEYIQPRFCASIVVKFYPKKKV